MARRAGALTLTVIALGTVATLAGATTVQLGNLRITVLSQLKPYKLPRDKPAPIAVFIAGHLESADGGIPPQLQKMRIKVNRHGLLQSKGLPVCQIHQVQPASTERALANCGDALIGSGQFWAHIILPGQDPYPTRGRMLIFNGRRKGLPTLLAQIYTANPFNSSFTIAFAIKHINQSTYGTELTASLPQALGDWGYLDRIKLTLRREYTYRGRHLSYFNAACPAPPGATVTAFSLAHVDFVFDSAKMAATVAKSCGVRE
ncbi:MAG TPA: hypothetical protein VHP56_06420 [Solirubrobacterales bacterium]|jgi:hypothetical protein|nr:hypothetical protein [Solirubrobacterales bacterium]